MFSPWSELRFAARRLRRAPGFAAAVVLVLALGVGAATAVFSLVNGILLEPLPFPESGRLVRLMHTVREPGPGPVDQSDASVLVYQDAAHAFDGVAAWRFDGGNLGASVQDQSAIRVRGARVTWNFFDVLGVRPALGRGFATGEDRAGANRVVVLSYRIWRERFDGDPNAVGRQVVVNDVPRTIIGIMPPRFAYPANHVELWLPLALDPAQTHPATFDLVGIARLKRGVSTAAARADLTRVLGDSSAVTSQHSYIAPQVQSLRDSIVGPVSHLLWLVFGGVLLVLLVACTNVAGLFLVRAERMQLELAVRGALGSGLAGMFALTLSESSLLSAVAGGAGVWLAALAMSAARSAGSALSLPRLEEVGIDARVLLFALGITVFCALAVSLVPLLRARRASLAQVLRGAGVGPTGGRAPKRARDALVVAQITLGVVLVAVSGLMTRSFLRLQAVRPGFEPDRVVTSRVVLPFARYSGAARRSFYDSLVREAKAIPGVRDVGLTDWVPLSGDHGDMAVEVEEPIPSEVNQAVATVDASYFRALRIPLLRGRTFAAPDPDRPSNEVVVSRGFAERYWPGASPLGKRLRPLGGQWHTIVGEVGDVHYDALDQPARDMVYFPIVGPGTPSLVVRTDAREGDVLSAIRGIVRALDPAIPTYSEGSLRQLVDNASARARTLAVLLAMASIVTSLLAAVGLYGIMAYTVTMRRRELGIRMAIGARPRDVSRMVSLVGVRLAGVGIAIGTACTLPTSQLLRGLLYGVSPTDPVTLSVTPVAVFVVALVATWIPARRAAAVHPSEALRSP
jgi:putative ABC transport system permease protein